VDKVDLRRYAGKWYGIARYPNRFRVTVNPTRLLSTGYEVTEKSKWSMRAVRRMGR
jgi:lipocalin